MKRHTLLLVAAFLLSAVVPTQAALYIVGSAIGTGWTRQPMTEQAAGVYTWQGWLYHGGELKFMVNATDWGDHWGPAAAGTRLERGAHAISLHTSGDHKYRVDNIGLCRLTVDTGLGQIEIADSEGRLPAERTYPPRLYAVGTAVGTAFSETNDFALHEDTPDGGTYSGILTLSEGTMALHSKPYKKSADVRPATPLLASGATEKLPKLRYQMETDRCSYAPGQAVAFSISPTPPDGARIRYRFMGDTVCDTLLNARSWTWQTPPEDFRGYMAEAYLPGEQADQILATIAIDVSSDWTRFPRYGFVANFGSDKTLSKTRAETKWLNRCHINGVQFQDWHFCHDHPLGGTRDALWSTYKDVANRTIFTSAIKNYLRAQHDRGMKSIFYNLCFGALDGWQERGVQQDWFIYKDRNHQNVDRHDLPDNWKSDIYLLNPANQGWLSYLAERNDEVYSQLDFDGFQIDQLGARGTVYDYDGNPVDLREAYAQFITYMKNRHPDKRLVMNAVSGWGTQQIASTGKVDFFYNEVWGNQASASVTSGEGRFSNIKNVVDQNLAGNPSLRTVLAAYMNYCTDSKPFNTAGVVMADAVMFALGASHLELGADHMLCREYFPYAGMQWNNQLEDWMTRYYDFLTAYENLLRDPWKERTTVKATCSDVNINQWEPVAGQVTLLAREVDGRQVLHLLNFTREESSADIASDYLLCWHDNMATRPWPRRFEALSVRLTGLTGMGRLRRIWAATPDYMGGALQEITDFRYTQATGTLTLTVPSLQFWTMIVIEPETATTRDNSCYAPSTNGESLVPGIPSSLAHTTSATRSWALQLDKGTYKASADIPSGTLTLQRDKDDAVIIPLADDDSPLFDLSGRPIVNRKLSNRKLYNGIVVGKNRKVWTP